MVNRGRGLGEEGRARAVELVLAGNSYAAVARTMNVDHRTVRRWHQRWAEGEGWGDRQRRPRNRETTEEEDAAFLAYAREHVFVTASEIQKELDLVCSLNTIRLLMSCKCWQFSYASNKHKNGRVLKNGLK